MDANPFNSNGIKLNYDTDYESQRNQLELKVCEISSIDAQGARFLNNLLAQLSLHLYIYMYYSLLIYTLYWENR